MLRKKGILLSVTVLLAGMLLAGCSNDNDPNLEIEKNPERSVEKDFGDSDKKDN